MDHIRVCDPCTLCFIIEEVKEIFDSHWDCVCPWGIAHGDLDAWGVGEEGAVDSGGGGRWVCDVEEAAEEVINKLLENAL